MLCDIINTIWDAEAADALYIQRLVLETWGKITTF